MLSWFTVEDKLPKRTGGVERLYEEVELKLNGLQLSFNDITTVSSVIRKSSKLKRLMLYDNDIGDRGCKELADSLENSSSCKLEKLYLNICNITAAGMKHLSHSLAMNSTITMLELSGNEIGDLGVMYLAESLKQNKTLKQLYLNKIQISRKGVEHLSELLNVNRSLEVLHLSGNKIGDQGAQILSESLKSNTRLRILDLSHNQIGDVGAKDLASSLRVNKSLKQLYLITAHGLTDTGAHYLSDTLDINETLEQLYISDTAIQSTIKKQIEEKLQRNRDKDKPATVTKKEAPVTDIIQGTQTEQANLSDPTPKSGTKSDATKQQATKDIQKSEPEMNTKVDHTTNKKKKEEETKKREASDKHKKQMEELQLCLSEQRKLEVVWELNILRNEIISQQCHENDKRK